jgi:hypothetical protein
MTEEAYISRSEITQVDREYNKTVKNEVIEDTELDYWDAHDLVIETVRQVAPMDEDKWEYDEIPEQELIEEFNQGLEKIVEDEEIEDKLRQAYKKSIEKIKD